MDEDKPVAKEAAIARGGAGRAVQTIGIKAFLEGTPPGVGAMALGSIEWHDLSLFRIVLPNLTLHCGSQLCGGPREFAPQESIRRRGMENFVFAHFQCENCGKSVKSFALIVTVEERARDAHVVKLGETPPFGPQVSSKVSTLVGSAREYYFKGTRSENQGLGIAAFAYYRRVVEDRKDELLSQIRKVAEKLGGAPQLLEELDAAMKETQFTNAVDKVKHAIPQTLLIDGHNPLTLLHAALSEGLHARTDQECLEIATSIRVVLADFVERASNAIRDDAELKAAVGRLLRREGR